MGVECWTPNPTYVSLFSKSLCWLLSPHRTGETLTRLVCRNWSTLPFIFVKFADEQNRIRNCRLEKIIFSSGRHLLQVMKAVWLLRLHGCHRFGNPYRSLVPRILSVEPITVVNFFVCKKNYHSERTCEKHLTPT